MRLLFLIPYLLILSFSSMAQTIEFEISLRNNNVGSLYVTKKVNNSQIIYEVKSKINLKMGFSYSYKLDAIYENGTLKSSVLVTYLNGKLNSSVKTVKLNNFYQINKNGTESKYYGIINYSEPVLYFEEPKTKAIVYSEFLGFNKKISKSNSGNYNVVNPDNENKSNYRYKNGKIESIDIDFGIIAFNMTRIK